MHPRQRFVPVEARHDEVQQDDVDTRLAAGSQQLERGQAVSRRQDVVALLSEQALDQEPIDPGIVHDEHPPRGHDGSLTLTTAIGRLKPLSRRSPTDSVWIRPSTASTALGARRIWPASAAELRRDATMTAIPTMP
jgi:hypothetical protein